MNTNIIVKENTNNETKERTNKMKTNYINTEKVTNWIIVIATISAFVAAGCYFIGSGLKYIFNLVLPAYSVGWTSDGVTRYGKAAVGYLQPYWHTLGSIGCYACGVIAVCLVTFLVYCGIVALINHYIRKEVNN